MTKIILEENSCIGCGACISLDPEHFNFSDEGLSTVISNDNLETDDLKNAIESCPTNAITLGNAKEETSVCNCEDCDCDTNCSNDCHCENCHNN